MQGDDGKPRPEGAWGRTGELVKTYKFLNDPQGAPSWSIRFVGALAIVAILAAGGGAVYLAAQDRASSSEPGLMVANVAQGEDGTRTDYVGYDPSALSAGVLDADAIGDRVAQWEAEHPDAKIISREPVMRGGQLVGWNIRYTP